MSDLFRGIRVDAESAPASGFAEPRPETLDLELRVRDPEVIDALWAETDLRCRHELALSALRIGILALGQAKGRIDAGAVRREGERLVAALRAQLDQHREGVTLQVAHSLEKYFDPESGHFTERVQRLVREGGEIEQLLRRQIGAEDSELRKTLEQSPLTKLLSPEQSEGFLGALHTTMSEALANQRERILREFTLDHPESALARLVRELTERHGKLEDGFKGSVKEVVKEFSLDDPESALSRLVGKVQKAQEQISNEFSLDRETSALARMRNELLAVLEGHKEDSAKFREEVRTTLAAMQARKRETERSPRHGRVFEDEVFRFLQEDAQRAGDVATPTGSTTGLIKHCRKGDVVIELGADTVGRGTKIVAEAKEREGYGLREARKEIEEARKNRGAVCGLFVFSAKTAPEGLHPFARYGDDVVVVWDAEDPATDVYLRAGLSVARALSVRAGAERRHEEVDFEAIERAIRAVEKLGSGLTDVSGWSESIRSQSEKILNRVRTLRKELERQVGRLDERFGDLRDSLSGDAPG